MFIGILSNRSFISHVLFTGDVFLNEICNPLDLMQIQNYRDFFLC
jgi:hypothetical protein